jgi:uncharacterized protein (TIGR02001 family)
LGPTWIHGLAPLIAVLLGAGPAWAQLSGSVTLATDYRLRGVSLTDRRPALSLAAAYDDPSGFYAGGAVIAHNPESSSVRVLGHTEYLGFAARGAGGTSWDVGFANVDMTLYLDRKYPLEYRQVYVGVAKDALSARLSYSPDYPREGVRSVYLDLNGAVRPAENWRLTGHLGAMSRLDGDRAIDGKPTRYDVRLGLARTFDHGELQLAWNAVTPRPRPLTRRTRGGLSLAASYFF